MFRIRRVVAVLLHHDDLAATEDLLSLPLGRVVRLPDSLLVPEAAAVVGLRLRVGVPPAGLGRMLEMRSQWDESELSVTLNINEPRLQLSVVAHAS